MIRSTFAGFTTAQLAMAASQRALDVVGQNIANINTVGYTKQRLDIASLNTQKANTYNSIPNINVGYGVEMTAVSQLRDPFLDAQYRSQISKLGTTDAHAAGYEQLTSVLDETAMDGVRAALTAITSSLSTLSTQAGNKENDTMVRSNMQILLNLFREDSVRLQDIEEDSQSGFITSDIPDLNKILQNIAELNTSIKNSQVLGNPALELQDDRNNLLDELGSYLPISVKYSPKEIGPGMSVEVLDVTFTDAEGQKHSLISDGRYGEFSASVNPTTQEMTLTVMGSNGGSKEITDLVPSGTLRGTLDFLNRSGDFDNPPSDFRGVKYYQKALDSLVDTFAKAFNNANVEKDANGNQTARPLFETKDGSTDFTATNIKIAKGWLDGTYGITLSNPDANQSAGSTADENVLNMIKLLEKDHSFPANGKDFFKGSFYNCFANLETTLGVDYKSAETTLENHIAVLNQTANSRDGVSGVQLDEEGMDLLHYNQSYTAAARLMTTLDEALDVLINRTGVVGR